MMIRATLENWAVRLGLTKAEIFGENHPYPNPHGFETTPEGVPIVPRDEVKKGGMIGQKTVFSGGEVVNGSGRHTFINRTDMGGTSIRKGQMFAFENSNPDRPALVFEVVDTDAKGTTLETQDVGFLERSVEPETVPKEAREACPMLIADD